MADRTENSRINLYINNGQAIQALDEYKKQQIAIRKEQKKLAAGSNEWMAKQKELNKVTAEMVKYAKSVNLSVMSERQLAQHSRKLRQMKADLVPGTKAHKELQQEIDKTTAKLREARGSSGKLSKMGGSLKGYFAVFLAGAASIAGIVAGLKSAVTQSMAFQKSMANVFTLLSGGDFDRYHAELERGSKQIMKDYGKGQEDVNKAMFDAISAGVPAAKAVNFLNTASKLAVGGVTELSVATDGLTSVLNAYKLEADEVDQVAAAFFSAQKEGKTTVEELAAGIGQVAPIADSLGVSYQELLSQTAALTKGGISTAESFTAIKGLLNTMIKPTDDLAGLFQNEFGHGLGVSEVKARGFGEIMEKLNSLMQKYPDELSGAISNIRGLTAATALSGQGLEEYQRILGNVAGDFGEMSSLNAAFETQQETAAQIYERSKQRLSVLAVEIGERVMPAFSNLLNVGGDLIDVFIDQRTEGVKLTDEFVKQRQAQEQLEQSINPLLERYDQLKSKSELNRDEQEELEGIIQTIATTLPTATTAWDEYGNAIDISTEKAKKSIKENARLLQAQGRAAINQLNVDIEFQRKQAQVFKAQLEKGKKFVPRGKSGASGDLVDLTTADVQRLTDAMLVANERVATSLERLRDDFGIELKPDQIGWLKGYRKAAGEVVDEVEETNELTIEELKALSAENNKAMAEAEAAASKKTQPGKVKELSKEEKAIAAFIKKRRKAEEQLAIGLRRLRLDSNQQEIEAVRQKYEKLIELALQAKQDTKAIEEKRDAEIAELREKQLQRFRDAEEQYNKEAAANRQKAEVELMTDLERERFAMEQHFTELISLHGLTLDQKRQLQEQHNEAMAAMNDAIREEERARESEDYENFLSRLEEKFAAVQQKYGSIQNVVGSVISTLDMADDQNLRDFQDRQKQKLKDVEAKEKAGLISKERADAEKQRIEEETDKKTQEIQNRQFERGKVLRIGETLMNTGAAIMAAFRDLGPIGGAIAAAIIGATGAAQAIMIGKQKPPSFRDGTIIDGPAHEQGGIDLMIGGRKVGEMEGKEAIIGKASVAANKPVIDAMLRNPGKTITPAMLQAPLPQFDVATATRNVQFENGGVFDRAMVAQFAPEVTTSTPTPQTGGTDTTEQPALVFEILIDRVERLTEEVAAMRAEAGDKKVNLVLHDLHKAEGQKATVENLNSI